MISSLSSLRRYAARMITVLVSLYPLLSSDPLTAQIKPAVGIRQNTPSVHAFTNARIVISPGKIVDKGTLVIRDGIITAVGKTAAVPADARIWDMSGMTLYAGLIDSYSDIGMPKKPEGGRGNRDQQQAPAEEARGVKHWNSNINSGQNADQLFQADAKAAEKLRSMGFTTALVVPQKGIFRGTSALMNLGDGTPNQLLVKPQIAQHVTFETSSGDEYPNSLMGTIAFIRQTTLDAQWHRDAMKASALYPAEPRPEYVADLAALENAISAKQPLLFETTDEQSLLRASKITKEFGLKLWARGSGFEYRRLDAVKQTGAPLILPINFPEAPTVQLPEDAISVTLSDLRHWDEAPENPMRLKKAGVPFVLTTATLKDAGNFTSNLRKAIERGFSANDALAALTTMPAKMFGVDKELGTLEVGKIANIIVSDGDLFAEKTKIRETWIDGKRYEVKAKSEFDPRGTWYATLMNAPVETLSVVLKGEPESLQGTVKSMGKDTKATTASYSDLRLGLVFTGDSIGMKGVVRMSGTMSGGKWIGTGELVDGMIFKWSAMKKDEFKQEPDSSKPKPVQMASFPPVYPPAEFGRAKLPDQPASLVFKDATVWTCGPQGVIEHGDVLIERGKIIKIGTKLAVPAGAVVVNATGKHISPGLIDCHSHSAAAGSVNETGKAITAEVRIGDIIDADDIGIYRELAGGLTAANVLHGSANAIGGQNQVIKLRWGMLPEEMKFEGAIPGIKFALGENPKQSNWGERYTTRYPQTRSGVEQIIRDEFKAALDYDKKWNDYKGGKSKIPPRRDLQAETILEILRGKRLVHSHSYRQDEILMLVRVADEFGFKIGTFQHVLEGYKVADAIAKHGAGASAFSDWWAYKFEVYDAIPYAGALMHNAGVVVSFNSDSDEQARRLNTEAAKAVKYGGVSQEDALKFVTLNPAKQLRVDKRVGSLEAGKDADIAVWSGNPLSTYTICEQTWVDGRKYFDREEDRNMNDEIRNERAVLIQKVLGGKKGGDREKGPVTSLGEKQRYSCQDEVSGKDGH
jgi:imidazolonepropionase-like amidohydrolase